MTDIQNIVKDFLEQFYIEDCKLNNEEIKKIVDDAKSNESLCVAVENAVVDYIREYCWDIGKPDSETAKLATEIVDDYKSWEKINKVNVFLDRYSYLDLPTRRLMSSILRGRKTGELRKNRGL